MTLSSHGFPVEGRGLNAEQLSKVQAFKALLQQSGAWDDKAFDGHDCARFLKARNYDLQAAKQMWDSMLSWRRENRVATIHEWFVFHERREYDAVFPTGLHKTTKEGHPVLIQQLGRVNIGALYKVTTDDRIRLAHIAENEHLRRAVFPACSRTAGRPIDQIFTIIDLEGVAFTSMMRTTSLLKMFMAMDSNNYPETLAHMCIINAPGWFSTSWGAVKSVLSGETVRKIQILGKDYQSALLRHIAPENLLVEYGGLSRGVITAHEGPWQEPIPEPPAPVPLVPLPLPLVPAKQTVNTGVADTAVLHVSNGGGDQRTPRDVSIARRSQSPIRPGAAKTIPVGTAAGVVPAAAPGAAGHPAPPASPPLAKRPHYEEPQPLQPHQTQAQQTPPTGSSPAPSFSDSSSDAGLNMSAPLMSNFLPSSASEPLPAEPGQCSMGPAQAARPASPPLGAGSSPVMARRGSSTGGGGSAGGLVHGFVAGLQAVASHVGYHPHTAAARPSPTADGVNMIPSGGSPKLVAAQRGGAPSPHGTVAAVPVPASRGAAAGPAQLQLTSPQEDTAGPGTTFSTASAVYTPLSPVSPVDSHAAADTATSRLVDGVLVAGPASATATGALGGVGATYSRQASGGGSSVGLGGVGASQFASGPQTLASAGSMFSGSGMMGSLELLPGAASLQTSLLQQPQQQQQSSQQQSSQQADNDDAESVRFSVMSQRSFYSALSHLDPSSSSGLTSPNEASENARRWSMQRELHAAAIASALAATAEQRRAAAAAAAATSAPSLLSTGNVKTGGLSSVSGSPMPAALASVSYGVPAAAQQAFGSYLDQPPPYGSVRTGDSSFTSTSIAVGAVGNYGRGSPAGGAPATFGELHDQNAVARAGKHDHVGHATRDSVTVYISGDGTVSGVGISDAGLSRSNSGVAVDDCSLGAGAVRWARGWFFRRRNYGRLVEAEGSVVMEATGMGGGRGSGGGAGLDGGRLSRKGSTGALYASMQDGPGATSPSKIMPKGAGGGVVHHSRGNSWEWDQPSPYDIDQSYSRGGTAMQRDMSFGRGGERRRLLRSESPGCRRSLERYCGCLPCCTVM